MKNTIDIKAMGEILLSIFIFILALRETSLLIKILGIAGSLIFGTTQIIFLWGKWFK